MKKLSVIGHQLSVIGHQLSGVGCQVSVCRIDAPGKTSSVLVPFNSKFNVRCSMFNVRCSLVFIVILLSFLFLQPAYAAEKAPFDAYAWYLPYGQVLRVNCQLSKDETVKLEGKKTQLCIVLKSQEGKTIFDKTGPFEMLPATEVSKRLQFKQPLPEGTHTATVQLIGGDGSVIHSMGNQIVVRKYAFEHNSIGKERVVVPPFEPITANANLAKIWGREISFAANGLPEKIVVLGKDILASGGVKIILKEGQKTSELQPSGPAFSLKTVDGYDATGSGGGSLGLLKYKLDGRLEYDGAYFIRLEIDSAEREVPVDSLTLLIPFADGADTFSFQKNDRDTRTSGGYSRFDGIRPEMQGVIWDARKLPARSAYGLSCDNFFVPSIYVGSGSRGLWYYADSDWDWYLNPANEHATLERVDGRVQLRVLLVNDRLKWKGKRVFDFVLMPQPVKPMPAGWRKVAWGYPENQYVHDTSGWRYYGDGVNAFTLSKDEDYLQLGRVLAGETKPPEGMYGRVNVKRRDDPRPQVLYGSSLMAGTGP
ncbi:MAG: glycoside hydrolase domain-containing protein, partial [Victivallales bacterium]